MPQSMHILNSSYPVILTLLKVCQLYFGFSLPSEEWVKRVNNLDAKYIACERAFVYYGSSMFYSNEKKF